MREFTAEQLEKMAAIMDDILSVFQKSGETYVEQSSPEAFAFAVQYAQVLKQRTQLLLEEGSYVQLRDQFLADNLRWIVEFVEARGHDKVFVSAHNGHIEKTSSSLAGYKAMGEYIHEQYGAGYFAIGTDVMKSEFQAYNSGADERQVFTVKNGNALVQAFRDIDENVFYVDFAKATQSGELSEILSEKQKMVNIGDDFRSW